MISNGISNRRLVSKKQNGHLLQQQDSSSDFDSRSSSPALPLEPLRSSSSVQNIKEETESSSAKSQTRKKCRDISTLVIFLAATAITNAAYSLMGPFFPNEAKKKGATPAAIGIIIAAAPFWVAILSPVVGIIHNIVGTRFMVFFGLLLIGTAYILLAFVTFIPVTWLFILVTFLLRSVEGVGTAMFKIASFSRLPTLFPKSIGTISGLIDMAGGLGFSFGFPLGGALFELGGFHLPFIVIGVPTLAMIIPCVLLVRKADKKKEKPLPVKSMGKILADAVLILLFINMTLSFASMSILQPTLEPYLIANFNLTPALVGLTTFISALTFFLAAFPVGIISDKIGHRRSFSIIGAFLIVLSFIILAIPYFTGVPKYWYFVVSLLIDGVGIAFGMITAYSDMIDRARISTNNEIEREVYIPFISGIASCGLNLGEFLGSLLGGILTQFLSFTLMVLIFAEVMLAQAVLLLVMSLIDHYAKI